MGLALHSAASLAACLSSLAPLGATQPHAAPHPSQTSATDAPRADYPDAIASAVHTSRVRCSLCSDRALLPRAAKSTCIASAQIMLEILRDPLWQAVGALLAIAALVGSIVIFQLQRHRRGVAFAVLSRSQLLTVREELEGKLQVLYEGEPVRSLSLLMVRVWNSGNQPILVSDFERPIAFSTGMGSCILSAAVTDVNPRGFILEVAVEGAVVTLSPALLNPGDAISLKLLVRDMNGGLIPSCRIVGVKSIRSDDGRPWTIKAAALLGLFLTLIGAAAFGISVSQRPITQSDGIAPLAVVGIVAAIVGYALMAFALSVDKRFRSLFFESVRSTVSKFS